MNVQLFLNHNSHQSMNDMDDYNYVVDFVMSAIMTINAAGPMERSREHS